MVSSSLSSCSHHSAVTMKPSSGSVALVFNLMSLAALPSLELVRAVLLPSGSISTQSTSLTSVTDDSIHIDVDSTPPRTVGGNESGRKWRAARRQMLRRVFMLLSSPGEEESELRADKVVGTKVTGEKKRGRARTGDSTAVIAKSIRARRPAAGGVGTSGGVGQQVSGHHASNSAFLPSGSDSGKRKENDVNIVCPEAEDGIRYFRCPTADWSGVYYCIDDHALCDQTVQCPNGEDEDQTACMFHQMAMNYFKLLMDSFIALAQTKN